MIKECPFCGKTKLKIDARKGKFNYINGEKYIYYTASVRCNCCHARGPAVSKKFLEKSTSQVTILNALSEEAYNAWNNRL